MAERFTVPAGKVLVRRIGGRVVLAVDNRPIPTGALFAVWPREVRAVGGWEAVTPEDAMALVQTGDVEYADPSDRPVAKVPEPVPQAEPEVEKPKRAKKTESEEPGDAEPAAAPPDVDAPAVGDQEGAV